MYPGLASWLSHPKSGFYRAPMHVRKDKVYVPRVKRFLNGRLVRKNRQVYRSRT